MKKLLKRKKFLLLVVLLLLSVLSESSGSDISTKLLQLTPSPKTAVQGLHTDKQEARVVKVVDGDTITVLLGDKKEKVRIIGVNTPETVDPRRGVQCFGKEASAFTKKSLSGQKILLEADPTQSDRDKYNRLLRFVWINDGKTDFGERLISEGYANEYTYDTPYKYQARYKQAEKDAQQAKRGLWADGVCS